MANPTNFANALTGPLGGRTWYTMPRVEIFADDDPDDLETQVNDFLDALAIPLTPDTKYSLIDIAYAMSGTGANNTYSALINYRIWTPA